MVYKMLLYCTKAKPYIMKFKDGKYKEIANFYDYQDLKYCELLNGKIVAECDFEVDRIYYTTMFHTSGKHYFDEHDILTKGGFIKESSSLEDSYKKYFGGKKELHNYLQDKKGYAIHIKNLHIFDKPKELNDYIHPLIICSNYEENNFKKSFCRNVCSHNKDSERLNVWCDRNENWLQPITKAPQNMMYCNDTDDNKYVLISIRPEWLCKILNGEKTIEVRKKVLKEMKINL